MIDVLFTKLDDAAIVPTQAYPGDAGWDLHVLHDTMVGETDQWTNVRSGIAMAVPEGYYARLVGRSSAFRKKGLIVHEGIIDAGYRGELFSACSLLDVYGDGVMLKAGESICQIIIQPVPPVTMTQVDELPESVRGANGFGSSGR